MSVLICVGLELGCSRRQPCPAQHHLCEILGHYHQRRLRKGQYQCNQIAAEARLEQDQQTIRNLERNHNGIISPRLDRPLDLWFVRQLLSAADDSWLIWRPRRLQCVFFNLYRDKRFIYVAGLARTTDEPPLARAEGPRAL